MAATVTDLDLIPTEDLLKALKRRYDHMVFAGIKDMGGDQGEDYTCSDILNCLLERKVLKVSRNAWRVS